MPVWLEKTPSLRFVSKKGKGKKGKKKRKKKKKKRGGGGNQNQPGGIAPKDASTHRPDRKLNTLKLTCLAFTKKVSCSGDDGTYSAALRPGNKAAANARAAAQPNDASHLVLSLLPAWMLCRK